MAIDIATPWLKASQARQYLQISDTTLRKLIASGGIRSVRRGNTVFVHREWADAYMTSLPSGASSISQALSSS